MSKKTVNTHARVPFMRYASAIDPRADVRVRSDRDFFATVNGYSWSPIDRGQKDAGDRRTALNPFRLLGSRQPGGNLNHGRCFGGVCMLLYAALST
ncbi:hypothetical protein [Rhodococcus koreensis]|uniref:hypothetical protein n=1 Tax=Rhodococcus koreensis TaxID=99653 RepID=UPI001F1261E1|nr:hypothetical protein [Rhodococcus koreensis]